MTEKGKSSIMKPWNVSILINRNTFIWVYRTDLPNVGKISQNIKLYFREDDKIMWPHKIILTFHIYESEYIDIYLQAATETPETVSEDRAMTIHTVCRLSIAST